MSVEVVNFLIVPLPYHPIVHRMGELMMTRGLTAGLVQRGWYAEASVNTSLIQVRLVKGELVAKYMGWLNGPMPWDRVQVRLRSPDNEDEWIWLDTITRLSRAL